MTPHCNLAKWIFGVSSLWFQHIFQCHSFGLFVVSIFVQYKWPHLLVISSFGPFDARNKIDFLFGLENFELAMIVYNVFFLGRKKIKCDCHLTQMTSPNPSRHLRPFFYSPDVSQTLFLAVLSSRLGNSCVDCVQCVVLGIITFLSCREDTWNR